jgi:hypothetical protein
VQEGRAGVLYTVVGENPVYLQAARRSAASLKRFASVPVAVATNKTGFPGDVDCLIRLAEPDGYRAKILAALDSPFDRTLLLDADTYVTGDVSGLFALLDQFEIAAAHAPNRVTLPVDVPAAFPEFNTGVIAFRRNNRVDALLNDWLVTYDELASRQPPSKDQPSFRRAVYHSDVRVTTLPPECNQRFKMAGYFNQPPLILHGWASAEEYERVASALAVPGGVWDGGGVFAGRKVFNRHGQRSGAYLDPMRRLRPLKMRLSKLSRRS